MGTDLRLYVRYLNCAEALRMAVTGQAPDRISQNALQAIAKERDAMERSVQVVVDARLTFKADR